MTFAKRYNKLNDAQRRAVDTIDGPVMVVAGPGTGKTELLSMRVANILRQTDTLPENILCLTFTENGASAMRERLVDIIGREAYKVAIHTFHSFGTEIINQYGEYFYHGASFKAAGELTTYEILNTILDSLDHTNPLASKMNGEYTYMRDIPRSISELKRSGLTSDELLNLLDAGDQVIEQAEQILQPIFSSKITSKTIAAVQTILPDISTMSSPPLPDTITPLSVVLHHSLLEAWQEADATKKTTAITAWRNKWMEKDASNSYVMKSRKRHEKLRALSYVYYQYLARMQEDGLYDFDDMILESVHTTEVSRDLLYNLQEKYQYVMIDEFQDTNMAQMRLVYDLLDNPVHEEKPNILIVGDDDQAIYSFQGADVSNIVNFSSHFPTVQKIVLTTNYRSSQPILERSRAVIVQGEDRLEHIYPELDKNLRSQSSSTPYTPKLHEAETISDERQWLVDTISQQIARGIEPQSICVLTRKHHEISHLLPYFSRAGIPVSYEYKDNALDIEPIVALELFAHVVLAIHRGDIRTLDNLLPEFFSHPAWHIDSIDLWKLSRNAYESRSSWLDTAATMKRFESIVRWLQQVASRVDQLPFERAIDLLFGIKEQSYGLTRSHEGRGDEEGEHFSPLFDYYFSDEILVTRPDEYLTYLEALRSIRASLRDYHQDTSHSLDTFVRFVTSYRKLGKSIEILRSGTTQDDAINIMTAHKSKGLEFDHVYIVHAVDSIWGDSTRDKNRLISYPENLQIANAGTTRDERLRLFYVAMTRAKHTLDISYARESDTRKSLLRANFLVDDSWETEPIPSATSIQSQIVAAESQWYDHLTTVTHDLRALLQPVLSSYRLSATDLHSYTNIVDSGPSRFLLDHLLRFPRTSSPSAAFGNAIHSALQRAHTHFIATRQRKPLEDVVKDYEQQLESQRLTEHEFQYYMQKGADTLAAYLGARYDSFRSTQKPELRFANQGVVLGDARLTGNIDLLDIDSSAKRISITDYKTGKPSRRWAGKDDIEKLKLHKYKQQLMFYRLLTSLSRDYHQYELAGSAIQYVEPDPSGTIVRLEAEYDEEEYERFKLLVEAVWQQIMTLDFPDTGMYTTGYGGVIEFERYLIDNYRH